MRCALFVVAACASARPVEAPAAPSGPAGTIAGVVEELPGEPGIGVTIVAVMSGNDKVQQAVISDEKGFYSMDVPPGTYAVTMYYADETLELGPRVVVASATTNVNAIIDPVGRCCVDKRKTAVFGTQAERDAVATAVLERFLHDRSTLPGSDLLPKRAIPVDLGDSLTAGALPIAGARFVPATHALLDSISEHAPVAYIRFTHLRFMGDCALVDFGVAIAGAKTAPTSARELYELAGDRVMFRQVTARGFQGQGL